MFIYASKQINNSLLMVYESFLVTVVIHTHARTHARTHTHRVSMAATITSLLHLEYEVWQK